MAEMVTRPYARAFEQYAVANPEVLCLSADLTESCEIDGFRDRHPDQFLSLGMAEQNLMSFAGGLGLAGFRPFLHLPAGVNGLPLSAVRGWEQNVSFGDGGYRRGRARPSVAEGVGPSPPSRCAAALALRKITSAGCEVA